MSATPLVRDPAVEAGREVLGALTRPHPRDFAVRFWDGSTWGPDPGRSAEFTLVLEHPGSLRAMFWPPSDLAVGEAYMYGDYDVEGDMSAFVAFLRRTSEQARGPGERLALGWKLWRLPAGGRRPHVGHRPVELSGRLHSRGRDRQAVGYHYDTSNEFFATFLDPRLIYTVAYFRDPADGVEKAQEQQLDYICRKLRLRPGDRLLDVGCGWGGLITFAAEHYGADATGVTLSRAQAEFAAERIRKAGLGDRCRVELRDYRDIPDDWSFDKVSTVEVLEHFDESMLPVYFGKVGRLLRPGGLLYVQAITLTGPSYPVRWRRFIRRYIFPDGKLRPVSVILGEAEKAGFEVRDVECLREHYVLTLKGWLDALEARHAEATRAVPESTYRAFRLYLAGAKFGYESGVYNDHQVLFVKPDRGRTGLPLTRDEWLR